MTAKVRLTSTLSRLIGLFPILIALFVSGVLCIPANNAYSQVTAAPEATSRGGARGSSQSGKAGGQSGGLGLILAFELGQNSSPGTTYSVVATRDGSYIAYYCIVLHKPSDNVPRICQHDVSVKDSRGTIDQLLKIGKLDCKIVYSAAVDKKRVMLKDKECLTIQGAAVDMSQGRVFVLDMTGGAVIVKQAATPPAIASKLDRKTIEETADRLMSELNQALNDGTLETRVLESK